jgi:hypothetical protein
MSATPFLDLLLAEAKLAPEKAGQLAELLRPIDLTTEEPPRLLDAGEAALILGVHPRTLTRAAKAGRGEGATRCGRKWRFRVDELAFLPPMASAPTPAPPARPRVGTSGAAAAIRENAPRRKDQQ